MKRRRDGGAGLMHATAAPARDSGNCRDFVAAIGDDYDQGRAGYSERLFRRRFGVLLALFWRIHNDLVCEHAEMWATKLVVGGRVEIDSIVK
eukprot:IDg6608t1